MFNCHSEIETYYQRVTKPKNDAERAKKAKVRSCIVCGKALPLTLRGRQQMMCVSKTERHSPCQKIRHQQTNSYGLFIKVQAEVTGNCHICGKKVTGHIRRKYCSPKKGERRSKCQKVASKATTKRFKKRSVVNSYRKGKAKPLGNGVKMRICLGIRCMGEREFLSTGIGNRVCEKCQISEGGAFANDSM